MSDTEKSEGKDGTGPSPADDRPDPDCTNGLKRLYDSVVEEPLPDSFRDLLSRLDDTAK